MIAEVYGLPGSGKSTIARGLVALPEGVCTLVDFHSKGERYKFILRFVALHPILFVRWMRVLMAHRLLFWYKLHLLSVTFAKVAKAEILSAPLVLVDEGLLQRLLTVFDRPIEKTQVARLLPKAYRNGTVRIVHMTGGDFYRFESERQKDNSPRVKQGRAYLDAWKELQRENSSRIVSEFAALDLPVVSFEKEATPDAVYRSLTT